MRLKMDSECLTNATTFSETFAAEGTGVVDPSRLHKWAHKRLGIDLTESEVAGLLRDIGDDAAVDRACLEHFVLGRPGTASKRADGSFILDLQVAPVAPPSPFAHFYSQVAVSGRDDTSGGLVVALLSSTPSFLWCLRCDGTASGAPDDVDSGTTRLAPIVDVRIEEERVSSDLVAAGYVLVAPVGRSAR
jgi:hypothetical protein